MTVELRSLMQCPPELLPRHGEDTCDWEHCDLPYEHPGDCAQVSLSGLVIRVWS